LAVDDGVWFNQNLSGFFICRYQQQEELAAVIKNFNKFDVVDKYAILNDCQYSLPFPTALLPYLSGQESVIVKKKVKS